MSKYYKAEDIDNAIREAHAEAESNEIGEAMFLLHCVVSDLPTIEVSEDCISKHDIWKIIEDNAYWVRYNENSTKKGMTLTGINQALNECPPVIPTVSEDCISREWIKDALLEYGFTAPDMTVTELVEDAPSVTTEQSSKVGEWIPCTKEGLPLTELGRRERQKWYGYKCSKCNFIYKGNAITESPFCQNCGAKMMRGREE